MAGKRSNRKTPKFYCPHCQKQLWRLGSTKHFLFFEGPQEIREHFKLSRKLSSFLVAQNPVQIDNEEWIEEFFCELHGNMWLHIKKENDGTLQSLGIASRSIWKRSVKTYDPDLPNTSVGEYSYKMSRGRSCRKGSRLLN